MGCGLIERTSDEQFISVVELRKNQQVVAETSDEEVDESGEATAEDADLDNVEVEEDVNLANASNQSDDIIEQMSKYFSSKLNPKKE